jgi:polyhydroxyalkanoate synthesis regulator phasin
LKQTLKIGAMLLVVAGLVMTGIAVAQSGGDTTTTTAATAEATPLRSQILDWLAPLVEAGTIDQSQAEAVADTLAEAMPGFRGHMGRGLGAVREAADFLGMTPQEVTDALRDGQTLAEIAVAQGKTAQALIDHLAGLAEEHLDELVADGRITAEQKADMLEHMTERITDMVNGEYGGHMMGGMMGGHMGGPGMGHGRGMGGFGPGPGWDYDESDDTGA